MPPTPRVKPAPTTCTPTSTVHILLDAQYILALPTQHRALAPLTDWPYARRVRLTCVVAGNAGVEFPAEEMMDGDDVEGGVPVGALGERGEGEAADSWW